MTNENAESGQTALFLQSELLFSKTENDGFDHLQAQLEELDLGAQFDKLLSEAKPKLGGDSKHLVNLLQASGFLEGDSVQLIKLINFHEHIKENITNRNFEDLPNNNNIGKVFINNEVSTDTLFLYTILVNLYFSELNSIHSSSPSWLLFGAPHNTITGGPGSLPVPPPLDPEKYVYTEANIDSHLIKDGKTQDLILDGYLKKERKKKQRFVASLGADPVKTDHTDITVHILDTGWSDQMKMPKAAANNQLWKDLCSLKPARLKVSPYPRPLEVNFLNLKKHDDISPEYNAAHGIFIAGIIHRIVDSAKLHMVQVLNEYGVGTIDSLNHGIQQVAASIQDSNHVVNFSLTLPLVRIPLEELTAHFDDQEIPFAIKLFSILHNAKNEPLLNFVAKLNQSYRTIFDPLIKVACEQTPEVPIIAAAGNDGLNEITRGPANLANVIGVGAADQNWCRANFSNKPDENEEGFWAYGGLLNHRETSSGSGILSVYVADSYPTGGKNKTGWAEWAGTSFSTAVAAGTIALCMSNASTKIQDPVNELRKAIIEKEPMGCPDEKNKSAEDIAKKKKHHIVPILQQRNSQLQ